MSLRSRVFGVLLGTLVLVILGGILIAQSLATFSDQRRVIDEQLQPGATYSRNLLASLAQQDAAEREFLISGREVDLEPYVKGTIEMTTLLRLLRDTFTEDPGVTSSLDQVESDIQAWYQAGPEPDIEARRDSDLGAGGVVVADRAGRESFDSLRTSVRTLQNTIEERLAAERTRNNQTFEELRNLAAVLVIALIVLIGVVTVVVWIGVLKPIDEVRSSMRRVAAGELDSRVARVGPREILAIGEDAEAMRRRIVTELEVARGAVDALDQQGPAVTGLLTELAPRSWTDTDTVQVHGRSHAAEGMLAGDWWDVVPLAGGRVAVILADVSGHGVGACLVAARFKHRLTTSLRAGLSARDAFALAAEDLDENGERFLSCLLVIMDPTTQTWQWINAGHPPGLLRSGAEEVESVWLHPTGPLVSALPATWKTSGTPLLPGDLLLLMTDGITEARRGDEEFGPERVVAVLNTIEATAQPGYVVDELLESVRAFADDWRRDDVTCVGVRVAANPPDPTQDPSTSLMAPA